MYFLRRNKSCQTNDKDVYLLRFNKSIQTDATEQTSALQDNTTQADVELLNSGDSSTEALESQYVKVDIHPEL